MAQETAGEGITTPISEEKVRKNRRSAFLTVVAVASIAPMYIVAEMTLAEDLGRVDCEVTQFKDSRTVSVQGGVVGRRVSYAALDCSGTHFELEAKGLQNIGLSSAERHALLGGHRLSCSHRRSGIWGNDFLENCSPSTKQDLQ